MELHGGNTALPRYHKNKKPNKHFQIKNQVSGMDYLFLNYSLVQSYRLQQIIRLLLDTLQNLVVRSCCWRHHILESLGMGRNLFKNLTQMWTLKTTIKCWLTRCDLCWHSGVNAMEVSSHFLYWFKAQSTRPKELIPDYVNYQNPVIG